MEENPQINVQAVVEALVERIASLELEVAVLRTMLSSQKETDKEAATASEPETTADEPGLYL